MYCAVFVRSCLPLPIPRSLDRHVRIGRLCYPKEGHSKFGAMAGGLTHRYLLGRWRAKANLVNAVSLVNDIFGQQAFEC
jgi:hypothetical protein